MLTKAAIFLFAALMSAVVARAQSPIIARMVPAAIQPGTTTIVSVYGENLRGAMNLWMSFPVEEVMLLEDTNSRSASNKIEFKIRLGVGLAPMIGAVRLANSSGISELRLLGIDNFPNAQVAFERTNIAQAASLKPPCAVDGFGRATGSEFYRIAARRGEFISVEVLAQRLGSRLDPLLRLLDARGRELVYCDDRPGLGGDAMFSFKVPATGDYVIEVRDVTYRGGEDFFYRLRMGKSARAARDWPERNTALPIQPGDIVEREPNDSPPSAMKVEIPSVVLGRFQRAKDRDYYEFAAVAGERFVFRGATRSLGSPCDLFLRLARADGTLVADAEVNGADDSALTNKFAEAGKYHLLVEELNHGGGSIFFYRLAIEKLLPGFALTAETNRIEAAPGGSFEIKVNCARRDFDGPIMLALQGADEGVTLVEGQIAAKKNETVLKATVGPAWAPGKIVSFQIIGRAEVVGKTVSERASTAVLLKRQFPRVTWPRELDGLIALGIKAPVIRSPTDSAAPAADK